MAQRMEWRKEEEERRGEEGDRGKSYNLHTDGGEKAKAKSVGEVGRQGSAAASQLIDIASQAASSQPAAKQPAS